MTQKKYPLLFIKEGSVSINYTSPQGGGGNSNLPPRRRASHGQRLQNKMTAIWKEFTAQGTDRSAISAADREGFYLEFRSKADYDLVTKSLEDIRQGVRLLNIRQDKDNDDNKTIIATVYIPFRKQDHFIKKIQDYLEKDLKSGKPKNQKLVESIEDIKAAVLESFWQSARELLPSNVPEWCEVWLRASDEIPRDFKQVCKELQIVLEEGAIKFPERLVVLVKANYEQLQALVNSSEYLAEIRRAKEAVNFLVNLENKEQAEWVRELSQRLVIKDDSKVVVCILDTGINNGHTLIEPILADADLHTFNDSWGVNDHDGHGTNMCGVAIYGDLHKAINSTFDIEISHTIESGKILPPIGDNDPKLYGYITQQVVSLAEIQAPEKSRIICLAVTTKEDDERGRPSSWSGEIDNMASGAFDDKRRLIIISAGNVFSNEWKNYPEANTINSVASPAQSWNALTVGAYTEKVQITDPRLAGYRPIAPAGGLSPFSNTSFLWDKKWPIKPDILLEGGNAAIDSVDFCTEADELSILTTHRNPTIAQFDSFCMTSAATAKASWMAAQIQAQYPEMWPETIKGLMIHSADWTDVMKEDFLIGDTKRKKYLNLLKTCGYGVPSLQKAMYCSGNSLTLIAEEKIQPFDRKEDNSGYCSKDMHFYQIPWPSDILLSLGETPVKMRVTLSYFIEPGPGEVGWKDKYRYRSHGLKFDVNIPTETQDEFIKRINKAAREDDDDSLSRNDSNRWAIGNQNVNVGAVHSDFIEGTAAYIATCNLIGVFPQIGWWKERSHLSRWNKNTRYSLIVSIETPGENVDLYTPVAIKLKTPIVT